MTEPKPASDAIESLEALATALAALEPALEQWMRGPAPGSLERERARRAALSVRLHASRIAAVLAAAAAESASLPWHGQERRSPQRATNVARLPERPSAARIDPEAGPQDWEPF